MAPALSISVISTRLTVLRSQANHVSEQVEAHRPVQLQCCCSAQLATMPDTDKVFPYQPTDLTHDPPQTVWALACLVRMDKDRGSIYLTPNPISANRLLILPF